MEKAEKKLWTLIEKVPWFWLGLAVSFLLVLPYLVLGSHCYVQITDQLDGEVINYIYRAKYMFSGEDVIPEFMGGMGKSAMTAPAFIGVLLYKLLPPFPAFAVMHAYVILTGYVGMYLLGRQLSGSSLIAFVTAGIFVYLPFYPVYGLTILGQPLLFWACIRCCQEDCPPRDKWKYYLCILLYALSSSLVLAGFACIMLLAVVWLCLGKNRRIRRELGIALLILTAGLLLCNGRLAAEMLGLKEGYVSHREEMVGAAIGNWREYFKEIFLEGGIYAKSYNGIITLLTVGVLLLSLVRYFVKGKKSSKACRLLAAVFALTVVISVMTVLWKTPWVVALRMSMGGLAKTFQADRINWLLPLCWYVLLALNLYILLLEWKGFWGLRWAAVLAAIAAQCFVVYENSSIYHNLRLMLFPDTYHLMNWDDYYAEDVYRQIDEFIGQDKSSYRVASLGINPAAALYNGFSCLDGYSNYYSLDYKHEFREIIAKELEKNSEVRVYFDTWGNRCYLLNGETGNYMTIGKNIGSSYQSLELDTRKMYEMGARYLFSALPIDNREALGLRPVRKEPFETETSYYAVWVYEISGDGTKSY